MDYGGYIIILIDFTIYILIKYFSTIHPIFKYTNDKNMFLVTNMFVKLNKGVSKNGQ
jgi:hypothetical protein